MPDSILYVNGFREADSGSLWKWKGIGGGPSRLEDSRFSVAEFLRENGRKLEDAVMGPGVGFGVGCGVGMGMGVVGGVGLGGSTWNNLKMVFGIGMGCGVGLGIGYGQGIGFGASLDSIRSRLFPTTVKSKRHTFLQI